MGCPGSVRRLQKLIRSGTHVERGTSEFAAEGSVAHEVREDCLRFGFEPHDFICTEIQKDGFTFEVSEEMADFLLEGLDRIYEFDGELLVESRVNTTDWVGPDEDGDDQGGTLDAIVIEWKRKRIVISDLKYGEGIPVQAVGNKQLRIYLLGLMSELYIKYPHIDFSDWTFLIIIDQPRHFEGGGEWTITYDELMEFGEEVREKAEQTKWAKAPINPGVDTCQWCDVKRYDGACPEYEAWVLEIPGLTFDNLDADGQVELEEISGMNAKRRSFIIRNWPIFSAWYKKLHADTISDALNGEDTPGLKAVLGRKPRRANKDDIETLAWLKKQGLPEQACYTQKVLSPAQAEKALKRKPMTFPKSLLAEAEAKPVLVPVEDDRPAIPVQSDFDNLDADDDFEDI